jgi:hypothetical protein
VVGELNAAHHERESLPNKLPKGEARPDPRPPYPGRNKRPPDSKSDSLERFLGSGVIPPTSHGEIDSTGRKTGLAAMLAPCLLWRPGLDLF